MEWLILLLLVPAILVPVVLLGGFAGCSFQHGVAPAPAAPTVTAAPKNVDHITVSWQNTDASSVLHYHFVRKKGTEIQTDVDKDASITTVEDTGLEAQTDYTYDVSTITANGTSAASTVMATTFKPAFDVATVVPPSQSPLTLPPGDYCFVQRINAGQLLADGVKVGLKVRGSSAGNGTINSIYISRAAASGNPWDSAADLTPVITSALTPPDAIPIDLGPIDYSLDHTQDLIIAFDFTATSGAGNIAFVLRPGVTIYFKPGVQQASMQTRDPNYLSQADPLYLVMTIGVP